MGSPRVRGEAAHQTNPKVPVYERATDLFATLCTRIQYALVLKQLNMVTFKHSHYHVSFIERCMESQ